jgi:hypothetical protein
MVINVPLWVFEIQIIGFSIFVSGLLFCLGSFLFIGGIERLFNYWLWHRIPRERFLRAFDIAVQEEKEAKK